MMETTQSSPPPVAGKPGDRIRALRKHRGLTLGAVSERTGLAVSTLSKLEKGHVSLSYDKLMLLSKALDVDVAELLQASGPAGVPPAGGTGRRVVQRAGEGQLVVTRSYQQVYLATELLQKRITPIFVEVTARSLDEFVAEFGGLIRHPGEEFSYVLEGEIEFHSEHYAPVHMKAGDSIYFDSEMGHAYLKASQGPCRVLAICAPRGTHETMIDTFASASARLTRASAPAPQESKSTARKARKVT